MADQAKDNGPYTVYGRRTEHEAEVRVGVEGSIDRARGIADDMVVAGGWHQASVRDRNDQTVHVGTVASNRDQGLDGPDPLQAE